MTEQQNCPICQKQMSKHNMIKYIDHECKRENHFYGKRIIKDDVTKVKIRFTEPDGEKLYIKFNYDNDLTEVWSIKPGILETEHIKNKQRIPIVGTFVPDLSDLEKLKQKIKTYLIFS
jgi:hypothetical protein